MATDPERQIERLLRASAERRRQEAGDGFPLHPATRRLFQGEVARTYGSATRAAPRTSWLWRLAPLTPRLAWVCSIAICLGLVIWAIVPKERQNEFSAAETRSIDHRESLRPELETSRPDSPAPNENVAETKSELAGMKEEAKVPGNALPAAPPPTREVSRRAFDDARPPAAAQPGSKSLLAARGGTAMSSGSADTQTGPEPDRGAAAATGARRFAFEPDSATLPEVRSRAKDPEPSAYAAVQSQTTGLNEPAAAPAPAMSAKRAQPDARSTTNAAGIEILSDKEIMMTQRFSQLPFQTVAARKTAPASARPSVLNNFDVSQAGNALRITDEDGSVYSGSLETPHFTVVGTNRSLNQKVVFTGTFATVANQPPPPALRLPKGARSETANAQQHLLFQVQNSRISGKVVLDDRLEVPVDALAVTPPPAPK